MNEDIEALIHSGGTLQFQRNEQGNVACSWVPGASDAKLGQAQIDSIGPTPRDALVTVLTLARRRNAQLVNPGKLTT